MRTLPLLRRSVSVAVGRFRCCLAFGPLAFGCIPIDTDPVQPPDVHGSGGGNPSNTRGKGGYDQKAGSVGNHNAPSFQGEGGTSSNTAGSSNGVTAARPSAGEVTGSVPIDDTAPATGGTSNTVLATGGTSNTTSSTRRGVGGSAAGTNTGTLLGEGGGSSNVGGTSYVDSASIGGESSATTMHVGGTASYGDSSATTMHVGGTASYGDSSSVEAPSFGGTTASSELTNGGQSTLGGASNTAPQGTTTPRCVGMLPAARGCIAPRAIMGVTKPWGIALDETHAYVTSLLAQTGKVLRTPIASGPTETIADSQTAPLDIVVASGRVFWCTADATGYVRMAAVDGGVVETLAQGETAGIRAVNADADHAYYLTSYNVVMSVSIASKETRALSRGPYNSAINDMTLIDNTLFFANSGTWSLDFTRTEPESASISFVDVTGTPSPSALVTRLNYPQFWVAANAQYVFFNNDKSIFRVRRETGELKDIASFNNAGTSASPIVDMVADDTYLYFSDGIDIYRIPVEGDQAEQISWGWQSVAHLAVNSTTLAWTDSRAGLVVVMSKLF